MPLSRVNVKKIILRYVVTKNQRERENLVNSQRKRHIGEQGYKLQQTSQQKIQRPENKGKPSLKC